MPPFDLFESAETYRHSEDARRSLVHLAAASGVHVEWHATADGWDLVIFPAEEPGGTA